MLPKGLGDLKKLISKEKDLSSQIEEYKKILEKNPKDSNTRLKLGDLYAKAGNKEKAINAYTEVAINYAEEGFLVKAIAVNKIIVRLDPSRKEAHDRLADLYFQRGIVAEPLSGEAEPSVPKVEIPKSAGSPVLTGIPKEMGVSFSVENIPLLAELNPEDVAFLKKMATFKEFKSGDWIIQEGGKENSLFVLLEGSVKVFTVSRDGVRVLLSQINQGDFFGEQAIMTHLSQEASVLADTPCKILEIPEAILKPLVSKYPKVHNMLKETYENRELTLTLARVPLFSSLSPEERLSIAKHLTLEKFAEGVDIFKEGTPGDSLYIIKSGSVGIRTTLMEDEEVSVIKRAQDQKELFLATLEKGDFFGESALITKEPRSATATATSDNTELLKLTKIDLADIIKQYPRITSVLKKYHEQRIQSTMKSLKSVL